VILSTCRERYIAVVVVVVSQLVTLTYSIHMYVRHDEGFRTTIMSLYLFACLIVLV
jgi:hypothetical protein